jgi:hypothetical protein
VKLPEFVVSVEIFALIPAAFIEMNVDNNRG